MYIVLHGSRQTGREGGIEEARNDVGREGREGGVGREGRRKGGGGGKGEQGRGKLQMRYPEEGTGQYTVYSQTIPQRGPCP